MARTTVKKDSVKTVNYLNKDFNDFGDVLSYYIDSQFRESMLAYAEEKRNVYNIAQSFGYKPKTTSAATVVLDVFQTVPALNNKPDTRYSLNIPAGAVIKAPSTATTFRTTEDANFKFSSSFDPMTISTFESDGGVPTKYLLKKKVKAQSGDIISEFFNFNSAEKYAEVRLGNPDVIEILSCTDSDGNKWYEVDSLARDTIFEDMENNVSNDPQSAGDSNLAPYILKLKRVSRRFSSHINENDETVLRFGAGVSDNPDEEIVPNPTNVGSSLPGSPSFLTTAFDPSNFLKTSTFGLAPANTTLTIKYSYGGGIDDNVNQGEVKQITDISFELQSALLSDSLVQDAKDSVSFTNPRPATGGSTGESVKDVRENALAHFQSQQRAVTKDDYIIRAYSLPAKYGNVAKVHFVQDEQLSRAGMSDNLERVITEEDIGTTVQSLQVNKIPNPLAINMYTLGYDSNRKLRTLTETTKQNLKTYISQYRMITDAVNIKNAYVINIGINFSILTKVGFNKNDVLLRCVSQVQDFFDIDRWQIGQPVVLGDIAYELSLVEGVASLVPPIEDNPNKEQIVVKNLFDVGQGYSGNIYDMESSLKGGILYPALDPSIFEVKFPNSDIKGKVVGDNLGIVE